MADGKKLTKREKKAASFRQKQKGKTVDEDNAVPESDLVPDQEEAQPTTTTTTTNNKRKADSDQPDTKDDVRKGTKIDLPSADTENKPAKKKTRRGKTKAAEGSRFIVFVGNLSYTTTKEDLEKHFASAGGLVSVRLLTDKETKKPKGFAFLEFQDSSHLNKSLAFHHTYLKNRQINVELTAGGGGNTSNRTEKLKTKNERLQEERQKAHQDKTSGKIPNVRSSSYGGKESTADEF